jgi:predicted transcriptional regulator
MRMSMATSLRVPDETRQGFEELAQLSGRTRSELMIEALEEYLAAKRQQIALIQEGERALDEGRSRSHAAVVALLQERGILRGNYVPFAGEAEP